MPIVLGILNIVLGVLIFCYFVVFVAASLFCIILVDSPFPIGLFDILYPAFLIISAFFITLGGVLTLTNKDWVWAVVGIAASVVLWAVYIIIGFVA